MNKIKFNLLAIIGMMVAVATFAFTAVEKIDAPEDGWYDIELISGPSDIPSNQRIVGPSTSDPLEYNEEGCAEKENDGVTCAVFLTFLDPNAELPTTVADIDPNEIELDGQAHMPLINSAR